MNVNVLHDHLRTDLCHFLVNPSVEAEASLMEAIRSLQGLFTGDSYPGELDLWWKDALLKSVYKFACLPSKAGYLSIIRAAHQYMDLVNAGLVVPWGSNRAVSFSPKVDWWRQELEDKMTVVISKPNSITIEGLRKRLEDYCKMKGVEL